MFLAQTDILALDSIQAASCSPVANTAFATAAQAVIPQGNTRRGECGKVVYLCFSAAASLSPGPGSCFLPCVFPSFKASACHRALQKPDKKSINNLNQCVQPSQKCLNF